MSAAEKLKRLSFWQWRKIIREVVGVVAAADTLANWHEPRVIPTAEIPDITAAFGALGRALAALDKALNERT